MARPIEVKPTPDLEVQQHEKQIGIVFAVSVVSRTKGLDGGRVEQAAGRDCLVAQQRGAQWRQLALEPATHGSPEASLAPRDDFWRQNPFEGVLQQSLQSPAGQLVLGRNRRRELDQTLI